MAGRRHHIIQRLLLRGFASKHCGETDFAWRFRKAEEPIELSVAKLSVEKDFYGREGATNADPAITDFEGKDIAPLVQALRGHAASGAVADDRVAKFVAHFMVRTGALREMFVASSDYLIDKLQQHVEDGTLLDRILPGLSSMSQTLRPILDQYLATLRQSNPTAARESHNRSLASHVAPPNRVAELAKLNWFLDVRPTETLILGDVGPVVAIDQLPIWKALPEPGDVLRAVYVPIASDRLLVGAATAQPSRDSFDAVNRISAAASVREFFASRSTATEREYQQIIGTEARLIPPSDLDKIVAELIAGIG